MPEANFCQGCGKPLSVHADAGLPDDPLPQNKAVPPTQQYLCFRCSALLPADAKICEKCGLNVENLIKPQPQAHSRKSAGVAEVTFFSQPPPADPQMATLKTYAGWFIAILLIFFVSSAAYSWLEASNVIGRLVGDPSRETQMQKSPLGALAPRPIVPNAGSAEPDGNTQTAAVSDIGYPEAETSESEASEPIVSEIDKLEPKPVKPVITANVKSTSKRVVQPPSESANVKALKKPADSENVEDLEEAVSSENMEDTERSNAQDFTSETSPEQNVEQALDASASTSNIEQQSQTAKPKPKKRVTVTQIEPNNQQRATPASKVEDFFRRWKKSIKQGATVRPCTQQEKVLNQCY